MLAYVNCDMATPDCGIIDDIIVQIMVVCDIICYVDYDSEVKLKIPFDFRNIQYGRIMRYLKPK